MNTARKPVARQGSDPRFEARHMRQITVLSLIVMLLLGTLISVGLGALTAHFASDVVHKSLYAVLKTVCGIAEPLLQFFAFGILGYSVMRWGFSKSSRIFLLVLCCVFVQQLGSFVSLCVYYTPKIAFESILPSQSLVLLLNLCIVLLEVGVQAAFCVIYRAKHTDKAVMPVGITKKNAFSRKNPLSRVDFVMNLLAVLFSLIPAVLQAISDYRELGFFQNLSEFFTFIMPFLWILLFFFLGYVFLCLGGYTATRCLTALRRRQTASGAASEEKQTPREASGK